MSDAPKFDLKYIHFQLINKRKSNSIGDWTKRRRRVDESVFEDASSIHIPRTYTF
jgi:hypothetical protein